MLDTLRQSLIELLREADRSLLRQTVRIVARSHINYTALDRRDFMLYSFPNVCIFKLFWRFFISIFWNRGKTANGSSKSNSTHSGSAYALSTPII